MNNSIYALRTTLTTDQIEASLLFGNRFDLAR